MDLLNAKKQNETLLANAARAFWDEYKPFKTRISRQAAIIQCLKAKLAAAEQSEADAIKMMVAAMQQLKGSDHAAKSKHPEPD